MYRLAKGQQIPHKSSVQTRLGNDSLYCFESGKWLCWVYVYIWSISAYLG